MMEGEAGAGAGIAMSDDPNANDDAYHHHLYHRHRYHHHRHHGKCQRCLGGRSPRRPTEGDVLQPTEVLLTGCVQGQRARAPRAPRLRGPSTRYGVAFSSTAR